METTTKRLPTSMPPAKLMLIPLIAMALIHGSAAQYQAKLITKGDGLAGSSCRGLAAGPEGTICVIHPVERHVSVLDGFSIRTIPLESIPAPRVWPGIGDEMWAPFGPTVAHYRYGEWASIDLRNMLVDHSLGISGLPPVYPTLPFRENRIVILIPTKVFDVDVARKQCRVLLQQDQLDVGSFRDLAYFNDLIAVIADRAILLINPSSGQTNQIVAAYYLPPAAQLKNLSTPQVGPENTITVLGEASAPSSGQLVVTLRQGGWEIVNLDGTSARAAWRHFEPGHWWVMSRTKLAIVNQAGVTEQEFTQVEGPFLDSLSRPNGSFFIATEKGLWRVQPTLWQKPASISDLNEPIFKACKVLNDTIAFAAVKGLYLLQDNQQTHTQQLYFFPWPDGHICSAQDQVELVCLSSGLLVWSIDKKIGLTNPLAKTHELLYPPFSGESYLVGLSPEAKDALIALGQTNAKSYIFLLFDGRSWSTNHNLPPLPSEHGVPKKLLTDGTNVILLTSADVFRLQGQSWRLLEPSLAERSATPLCAIRLADRWVIGTSRGLLEFNGGWQQTVPVDEPFYSILLDSKGILWAATAHGVMRIENEAWINYGPEDGLPSVSAYVVQSINDAIWAGTFNGWAVFRPEVDQDPPRAFRPTTELFDRSGQLFTLILRFQGRDRWEQTPQSKLMFSYRIDGGSWTPFRERTFGAAVRLLPGLHRVEVRAMDRAGNIQLQPTILDIELTLPWYAEPRFRTLAIAATLSVMASLGLAINRHIQLRKSYAQVEKIVAQRTKELEKATEQLLHTRKMTALGTLAAGIAHDFNNILSVIRGFSQIIRTRAEDPEKVRTLADRILTACDQAAATVQSLLVYSRPAQEQMCACQLKTLVQETIHLLAEPFRKNYRIEVQIPETLPEILAIPDRVRQILLNLLLNAAEAMETGGTIRISAELIRELPYRLHLAPANASEYVALMVEDEGCGIPPELIDRIFEPFFTTKSYSAKKGTGLGLYLVYEFVRQMGGGLHVRSELSHGTTFTIFFIPAPKP